MTNIKNTLYFYHHHDKDKTVSKTGESVTLCICMYWIV